MALRQTVYEIIGPALPYEQTDACEIVATCITFIITWHAFPIIRRVVTKRDKDLTVLRNRGVARNLGANQGESRGRALLGVWGEAPKPETNVDKKNKQTI